MAILLAGCSFPAALFHVFHQSFVVKGTRVTFSSPFPSQAEEIYYGVSGSFSWLFARLPRLLYQLLVAPKTAATLATLSIFA